MAESIMIRDKKKVKPKVKEKSANLHEEIIEDLSKEKLGLFNNVTESRKKQKKIVEIETNRHVSTLGIHDSLMHSSGHDIEVPALNITHKKNVTDNNLEQTENSEFSFESKLIPSEIESSNYKNLNTNLNSMEPFLQAQIELKKISILDTVKENNTVPSAPLLSYQDFEELKSPKTRNIVDSVAQRCFEKEDNEQPFTITTQKSIKDNLDIKPYSEIQLSALYNNIQLEEKDNIVLEFLDFEKNATQHEFYEVVLNYMRARTSLVGTDKEIQAKEKAYNVAKGKVWIFEERTTIEEGMCEDDKLLTVNCVHEIAVYQPNMIDFILKQLKHIRETIFDSFTLHIYVAEMSKLQVENYLQKVINSCSDFACLAKNAPVKCSFSEHNGKMKTTVQNLKECISILFTFCRRNVKDAKFVRDIKTWLSELIAILLRVATSKDQIYILNHLMRCPSGVGEWAAQYLQIVPPLVQSRKQILGSPFLDHLITVLAIILMPVKERETFLRHYKFERIAPEDDNDEFNNKDSVWIVVDSSGEDEEDSTEMWHYFKEDDIIQFLNQIPFEDMFKHVLLIESDGDNCFYNIKKASHHSFMKLFAFCTCLLRIFQEGLKTYCNSRFKGVVKRISRLIRHTVLYVTDHWENFLRYQEIQQNISKEDDAMLMRLQVEYDEIFENAVKTVFLSPRRGAWQFLAVIPYSCVSLSRLSKIAYKLHIGYKEEPDVKDSDDWPSILIHQDSRGRLQDQLIKMGDCESYYLLTALANMALIRNSDESEFINAIVCNIFDTAFVNEGTRETLNRTGRDLFFSLTSRHPFIISTILTELQEKLTAAGTFSIYLFRYLSFDKWHPTEEDLQCLSYWLLYTPPSSLENQLTRIILAKLNWGFEQQGSELVLPKSIHERIALLVVEAGLKTSLKTGQRNLISEGVKQVTSVVYAPSPEQVLLKWCWSMLNQLHLHQLDQSADEASRLLSNPSQFLKGVGDLSTSPSLEILKKGCASKNPMAIFASLLISSRGHSVPEICNHCSEGLDILVTSGYGEFALTVFYLITPFFFNQFEELVSDSKFMNNVQSILSSDLTYVNLAKSYLISDQTGFTLKLFEDLVVDQLTHYKKYNFDNASTIVSFWINILTTIPNWRSNSSVLEFIDVICEFALFDSSSWQALKDHFHEHKKIVSGEAAAGRTGLGSLLTWVSSGITSSPSLLIKSNASDLPWFALAALICEAQEEISSGLWKGLLRALHADPTSTIDTALKNVCSELAIDALSSSLLTIYRLGQQILDLPVDHPALPMTLQIFLNLHLSRTPPQPGQYDCSSVIFKFYEGYINGNFIKRIKGKVSEVNAFWEKELADYKSYEKENLETEDKHELNDSTCSKSDRNSFPKENFIDKICKRSKLKFLTDLCITLRGMTTWLDETRLYETGLYLPALPPKLLPQKLTLVFQESWEFWNELIDKDYLSKSKLKHLRNWSRHRSHKSVLPSPTPSSSSSPAHCHTDSRSSYAKELSPTESILKRLKEYDVPKPPPPMPDLMQKKLTPPIGTTLDKDSILYDIERYTGLVVNHAHTMMLRSREMCALDCVYAELAPQLWSNPSTKTVMNAKCLPKRNSKTKTCSGAASIVVEYCEKRLNEGVNARIEQNRDQRKTLLNMSMQTPPLQLCEAAVHLEALVNHVVYWHKHFVIEGNVEQSKSTINYGRELFYHLVQLTSEDTNLYPPAKQLITSCSDILGQEFLRNCIDCQESLVVQVLHSPHQVGVLLSPHFTPMMTPIQTYLNIYSSLIPHIGTQPDLCFMLLSKFEMESWLRQKNITCSERAQLINTVGAAISSLLTLGERTTIMCLELYRIHLMVLLNFKFHDHFIQTLSIILEFSLSTTDGCGDIGLSIWYDLINALSKGACEFSPNMEVNQELSAIKIYCQSQTLMSPQMIKDVLQLLSRHFIHYRLQFGLYGLYPKYKLFIRPITLLLAMISHSYIITANFISKHNETDLLILEIWEMLEGLWAAWIAPLGGKARQSLPLWIQELTRDKRILLPWSPGDVTGPAHAVALYSGTISFFHDTFVGTGSSVLSLYLDYYSGTYAIPEVKDHILSVVQSHMISLPWHHLSPTLKDVEIISKIINEFLPECHSFIGNIFIQISWNKVIKGFTDKCLSPPCSPRDVYDSEASISPENYLSRDIEKNVPASSLVKLHILLLNILVRISMEPSVRQSGLLQPLLQISESFQWRLVDAKNYELVINWFVMSCDPRIVLNMQNRNPIDVSIIRLLHVSGGYTRDTPANPHRAGPLKRRLLVRALCRLVITSATRHKILLTARRSLFSETFAILLTQMEDTVVEGLPEEHKYTEGISLSAEAVALIGGGASTPLLQEVCRNSLLEWLKGSHPSTEFLIPLIASISKGILQLQHRSPLMEGCLQAIFKHSGMGQRRRLSWAAVVQELSFPVTNPTPLLTFAAQENHFLVIFVHTRWRLTKSCSSEQSFVLSNLVELLTLVNPEDPCEPGLLLVVGEILQLIINELSSGPENRLDYNCLWKYCKTVSVYLSTWGEDRASQGILAAIGLGRKSLLSVRMRLICKSLHTFLTGQLLSPGFFCSINEHNKSISEIDESPITNDSCEESLKALHHLLTLRTNASYLELNSTVDKAISFIQDVSHTILDIRKLLMELVRSLYPEEETLRFIYEESVITVNNEPSPHDSVAGSVLYGGSPQPSAGCPRGKLVPNVKSLKSFETISEFENESEDSRHTNKSHLNKVETSDRPIRSNSVEYTISRLADMSVNEPLTPSAPPLL